MNESMERFLADWLHEGPEAGSQEGLERTLAATRRAGQRPGWILPARWLPLTTNTARTAGQRRLVAVMSFALLVLALVAGAIIIGAQQEQGPSPFRNGAIVYEQDGDLFIADQLDGAPRLLVGGPERDSGPVFSDQGDRIAFIRQGPDAQDVHQVMSVNPDGSGLMELASLEGSIEGMDWSPDGTALLVDSWDNTAFDQVDVIATDGSGSRRIDAGGYVQRAAWRPGGRYIVVKSANDDAFIADADGTNLRGLPGIHGANRLTWSPDGTRLTFRSGDGDDIDHVQIADIDEDGVMTDLRELTIVPGAQELVWSPDGMHLGIVSSDRNVSIASMDEDGSMTELRQLDADVEWTPDRLPTWSPDGSRLAFPLRTDSELRAAIVNADGSGLRLVGPEVLDPGHRPTGPDVAPGAVIYEKAFDLTWAPDGRSLVIFEHPWNDPDGPVGPDAHVWSVDVATGEVTEVQTPVETWQRLAP